MSFLKKLRREKDSEVTCNCNGKCSTETANELYVEGDSGIKILGSGCAKCNQLESETAEALKILGIEDKIEHVTDFAKIASYGVMTTPALVVDGKVASYGKVLNSNEIIELIKKVRG